MYITCMYGHAIHFNNQLDHTIVFSALHNSTTVYMFKEATSGADYWILRLEAEL